MVEVPLLLISLTIHVVKSNQAEPICLAAIAEKHRLMI